MAMTKSQRNAEERRWREEDDARTLAQADLIENDAPRLRGAKKAASRMEDEEREKADAMAAVAGKGSDSNRDSDDGKSRTKRRRKSSGASKSVSHNVFQRI